MRIGARLRVVIAVVLTALTPLAGESPPQQDARLIDLNVVAVDNRGQPLTDLTSDDLQVSDAGKPRTIVYFHHNDSRLQPPGPREPKQYSNRSAGTIPHATLILIDQLNQSFGTRAIAAYQTVRALESMESADDLFLYLLTVDGRFQAVHGFGEEGAAGSSGQPWTRQIKSRLDAALKASLRARPVDIDVAVREQMTFAALDAIGMQLSRFPGRKNIVWITDGLPLELGPVRSDTGDIVDFTPQIRLLSQIMDRSRIAIYPVRQVMLGSPDAIDGGTGVSSFASLNEFAGLTGGRVDAGKDIGAAVRQAVRDVRTSYQIGYFAPAANWDGKFHKLRVTTKRKGVRIQAKTGYYAWAASPEEIARTTIDSVLANPFDAGEIGLWGTVTSDPKNPPNKRVDIRIDANDVALAQAGGQYSGQLRVVIAEYTSDGLVQDARSFALDLRYTAGELDSMLRNGIDFARDIQIPTGDRILQTRIIVFDPGSNSVGSLTIPAALPKEGRR